MRTRNQNNDFPDQEVFKIVLWISHIINFGFIYKLRSLMTLIIYNIFVPLLYCAKVRKRQMSEYNENPVIIVH